MHVFTQQYYSLIVLTELNKSLNLKEYDVAEKLEKQRQVIVARNKVYRQTNGRSHGHRPSGTTGDYGPEARQPTLTPEVLQRETAKQMVELRKNAEDWENIERETRGQSASERWRVLRQKMLTASNFGAVCRRRKDTRTARLVSSLLYPSLNQTVQMKYGLDMEPQARSELSAKLGKKNLWFIYR